MSKEKAGTYMNWMLIKYLPKHKPESIVQKSDYESPERGGSDTNHVSHRAIKTIPQYLTYMIAISF